MALLRLTDIANKIQVYLDRIERDPELNPWVDGKVNGLKRYYEPRACQAGRGVRIRYVSYQGGSMLSKADALLYLEWLEAGNLGTHRDVPALKAAAARPWG